MNEFIEGFPKEAGYYFCLIWDRFHNTISDKYLCTAFKSSSVHNRLIITGYDEYDHFSVQYPIDIEKFILAIPKTTKVIIGYYKIEIEKMPIHSTDIIKKYNIIGEKLLKNRLESFRMLNENSIILSELAIKDDE